MRFIRRLAGRYEQALLNDDTRWYGAVCSWHLLRLCTILAQAHRPTYLLKGGKESGFKSRRCILYGKTISNR